MSDVTQRKTAAGDAAAQEASSDREARRLKVQGVGEGLKGYPETVESLFPTDPPEEPYLKVNTPNEYPQSSWGHVGRRPYGGVIKG